MKISSSELSTTLSNLLENSLEACLKSPQENRKIDFFADVAENGFTIIVKNSVLGVVEFDGDFPVSTKNSGGIGTKSIIAVAEKYNGFVRFSQEDEIFTTQFFTPL